MTRRSDGRVVLEFAGCGTDEPSREQAMRETHDLLIAVCPVRLGPVRWSFFEPDVAEEKLGLAGLLADPRAQDLVAWLHDNPETQLLIASVEVPA